MIFDTIRRASSISCEEGTWCCWLIEVLVIFTQNAFKMLRGTIWRLCNKKIDSDFSARTKATALALVPCLLKFKSEYNYIIIHDQFILSAHGMSILQTPFDHRSQQLQKASQRERAVHIVKISPNEWFSCSINDFFLSCRPIMINNKIKWVDWFCFKNRSWNRILLTMIFV